MMRRDPQRPHRLRGSGPSARGPAVQTRTRQTLSGEVTLKPPRNVTDNVLPFWRRVLADVESAMRAAFHDIEMRIDTQLEQPTDHRAYAA